MEKKLPMTEPMIKGYPKDANAVAILSHHEENFALLFSYFIQLLSHREVADPAKFNIGFSDGFEFYKNCSLLDVQRLKKHYVNDKWNDIHHFIQEAIDHEYYVYLIINCLHIPAYEEKENRPHDLLIYGYNRSTEQYDIADCFRNGKYAFKQCSFRELDQAYFFLPEAEEDFCHFNGAIQLIGYMPQEVCFQIHKVKYSLEAYLKGLPLDNRSHDPDHVYGIDGFDIFEDYITLLRENPELSLDIRPIYNFWEHKRVMSLRIQYMHDSGWIRNGQKLIQDYDCVEQQVMNHRNLSIKYSVNKDARILDKIRGEVRSLKEKERDILSEILHEMQI